MPLRKMYSSRGADFLSRFPRPFGDSSFESLYRYFRSMVGAEPDPESGLAVLEVRAFTPSDAREINEHLLRLSEQLVNRLNQRSEQTAVQEAQRRVAEAERRVRNARVALSAYRNQQRIVDPGKQAAGVLDLSNKLVSEYAALQAQLATMVRETPRHPAIPALRSQLAAVGQQIAIQNGRAVGTPNALASKLSKYEGLQVEQEFATEMLTSSNAELEQARADAQKQQFYLERVVEPNMPDDPTLPTSLTHILTIFGAFLCLYFIGWMVVVGILEHSPED
jgi:capsular polysaccharide transport system permease protein